MMCFRMDEVDGMIADNNSSECDLKCNVNKAKSAKMEMGAMTPNIQVC